MDCVFVTVTQSVKIPDTVYEKAVELANQKDMTFKEAIRHMAREGGYDV